jgi:uncharacterized protein involved in exopolysaccharide biosynthesis
MATLQTLPDSTTFLPVGPRDRAATMTLAVRSFLYAVFKHRRLVLGVLVVVFFGSVLAAILRPRQWLVTTKVLVKLGETLQLAPSEAPSRSINLPLSQEVVKTEADIVRSYTVVDEALRRLHIEPEEGTDRAELIDGIQRGLTVTPNPGTNSIQISFIGKDPKRAARLVNAITDVYIDHHNEVYGREGLKHFYDRQLKRLSKQMKGAQARLKRFMTKHNLIDLEQETRILNQDVIEQDKSLKAHRAKIAATKRKLVEVEQQIASTPQQIPFAEEYLSNPTLLTFRSKLAELEVERYRLLEMYMPTDRRVQDVEEQIANLKGRAKAEQERVLNKQTVRHNDLYAELLRNRMSLQTLLADAMAREPALADRLETSRTRLGDLRNERFALDNLKQEAEQKQYSYDLYWKKQEEARVTEAMRNQSMVNVSVVDRAVPPLEPINGVLAPLLLGILGGLALATATAVAVEFLNRRLRFEEEVERYLELPVLAVIPDLDTVPDVANP